MPIYEYVCHNCGKEFEAMQKFSEAPLSVCECGEKGKVERKLSLSAFHLHGSGWFKQGYGSSGGHSNGSGSNGHSSKSGAAEGSSSKSGAAEGSSSSKSESTTASTAHSCGASCACA